MLAIHTSILLNHETISDQTEADLGGLDPGLVPPSTPPSQGGFMMLGCDLPDLCVCVTFVWVPMCLFPSFLFFFLPVILFKT